MSPPPPLDRPARGRRVGLLALLTLGMSAGTATQFAVPALGPLILPDLDIGRTQLGALTTMFFLVGGAASPAVGRACDRLGGRRVLAATFLLGALALVALGLAPTYGLLLAASGLGGLAAATANPSTNRLVLVSVPERMRGAAVGLKQSGVQVATLLAGAVLPPLAVTLGWRPALMISGAVLGLGIPAVVGVVPRSADQGRGGGRTTDRPARHPTITALSGYALLMGLGLASIITYLPIYAVEELAQSVTTAGRVIALLGVGGIAARVLWGVVADRLDAPIQVLPVLAGGGAISVALLATSPLLGVWALWTGAALLGVSALGWNGVAMLVAMTSVDAEHSGWATGRVILAFYLGLVFSPVPFGWSADLTGNYVPGWIGVAVAFTLAGWLTARRARALVASGRAPAGPGVGA